MASDMNKWPVFASNLYNGIYTLLSCKSHIYEYFIII